MTFGQILPCLLKGERAKMWEHLRYDPFSSREYLRLDNYVKAEVEHVVEYDNKGGRPSQIVRRYPLTRGALKRGDWELVNAKEKRQ